MKSIVSIAVAIAGAGALGAAAQAAVHVTGNSSARLCYAAAAAQAMSLNDLRPCNLALEREALSAEDRVATLVNRGIIHFHRGSYNRAISDFDSALALDENQPEALLNKAITLMRRDESGEQALPFFNRALELGTQRPAIAYYGRGLAHHLNGDLTSAYIDIRRASELDPEWEAPREELDNYIVEPNS